MTIKKIITALCCVSIVETMCAPVHAEENEINDEKSYIISGDGSFDNPYVIDKNANPELAAILDEYASKIPSLSSSQTELGKGTTTSYYENSVLTVYWSSDATNGGTFVYTNGGGSVGSNGNVIMKHIEYIGYSDVHDLAYQINTANNQGTIINCAIAIMGMTVSAANAYLAAQGLSAYASAIKALAGLSNVITGFSNTATVSAISSTYNKQVVIDADYDYKGVIIYEFVTSYNGNWYANSRYEEWYKYSDIYKPSSVFGNGNMYIK